MIENFEILKKQLKELSEIINSFNSEAVQLRLIDLVFGTAKSESETEASATGENKDIPEKPKKKAKKKKSSSKDQNNKRKTPVAAGQGPVATIAKLAEGDFFSSPKSIKSIIEHCEVNMARKIKQNEISGKLARMVREGELKREKNADGQYEYSKP